MEGMDKKAKEQESFPLLRLVPWLPIWWSMPAHVNVTPFRNTLVGVTLADPLAPFTSLSIKPKTWIVLWFKGDGMKGAKKREVER